MTIKNCYNATEFRAEAKRRVPAPMFHYLDGGSDDEYSLARNSAAFADYELMPDYLVDVTTIDTQAEFCGAKSALPYFLAPTGGTGMFHHQKEQAVAAAANSVGVPYSLSTVGTTSLEHFAKDVQGPKFFQMYVLKDRGITKDLIARCKAAGYDGLMLTVDTLVAGNRERDFHTGMGVPPKFTLASILSILGRPNWLYHYVTKSPTKMENLIPYVGDLREKGSEGVVQFINNQFDRSLTWKDAEWMAAEWGGPLILKGLQSPGDARRAVDIGARGIMISNHGGRQLDFAPAPIDCVKAMRDAVGDSIDLAVDGGIRRGTDVVKALAAGANICSIGRLYLYALAAGGEAGVARALRLLKEEIERDMALLGCRSVAEIGSRHLIARR